MILFRSITFNFHTSSAALVMTPCSIFFFFFFALFIHITSALNADGVTLLSLLDRLTIPSSILSTWNSSDSTPCNWQTIQCDPNHNVISLNMSSTNVFGILGKEIGQLKYLETIDLNNNNISGVIPSELGNCTNLVIMDLSMNFFSGELPSYFGRNLPRLRSLSVYANRLNGTIPESLFQIPRLESVYLNDNQFTGLIPSSVGNMTELISLWLDNNTLSGQIPYSMGNCTKLEELFLSNNTLVGNLPASLNNLKLLTSLDVNSNGLDGVISVDSQNCKQMTSLILSYNRFRGEIPDLGNCTSLTQFAAVNNSLTGEIPSSIGRLIELYILYLGWNSLSGKIPPEIGNCKSLADIQVYENQLEGPIPREIGMLRKLQVLWLYSNRLSGDLPSVLWTIPTLQSVIIYRNNLSGELPLEITELRELTTIYLYDNKFAGAIPQGLGINSSLEIVDFTNNKFVGEIPPNLCFGKQLRVLNLGLNQFQGSIPSDVGSCSTLQRLRLRQNRLTGFLPEFAENSSISFFDIRINGINGTIPSSLGSCTNLSSINLSRNKLTGLIPGNLRNLINLQVLNLSSNRLQGPLPPQIANCVELSSLDVGFNSLNGSIPGALRSLTRLSVLILGQNRFSGLIPDIFQDLSMLREVQLGGNLLGGRIPSSLGRLPNLAYALNLSSNNLTGQIPAEFGMLVMLERLDISRNNLTGSLAPLDELRSLLELNVSYNGFEGPIPETLLIFLNSSPYSFLGNRGLCFSCQSRDGPTCGENTGLSPCEQLPSDRKKGVNRTKVTLIVVGSVVLCVVVLTVLVYCFLRFTSSEDEEVDTLFRAGSSIHLGNILKATEGLNERFIIGRGAHGIVYKVALSPDKLYAAKKLNFRITKGARTSMVRELETVGKIKHRNLVKVKDFWFKKDYGMILYKYMHNGSLHDVLYEISPPPMIEWGVRFKIALGIAQGLEYLHHDCDPVIVHRDIKPKNVLLDSEMEPHISDFGIAKLMDQLSASADSASVVGTIGYLAPETAFSTIWGKEADVYSYGVVLLEIITRKQALDSSFGEGIDIVSWAFSIWNRTKSINGIVDPGLIDILDSTDMEHVTAVFFVALRCTARQPNERPTMRDMVKHLTDINNNAGSRRTV